MNPSTQLTAQEMQSLIALLAKSASKSGPTPTWNDLLLRWDSFVGAVERGYQDNFPQYMRDIAVRNTIEDIVRQAAEPLRSKLAAMIRPADDRFHAATRDLKKPLSAGMTKWAWPWWARVPKKLVGELESDLRAEGILSES